MKKKYVAVMLGLVLSMSTASVYAAENTAETATESEADSKSDEEDSTLTSLSTSGTIIDADGNTVTIKGAILDIMMPKMDGITVLKNIRKQGNDVPVLILTARSEVDDRMLGFEANVKIKAARGQEYYLEIQS